MEDEFNSIENNDGSSFMTNESSSAVWEDLELKEIFEDELSVTNNLKTNINDIMANLKPRNIQETVFKLSTLNHNLCNDELILKSMERVLKNEK